MRLSIGRGHYVVYQGYFLEGFPNIVHCHLAGAQSRSTKVFIFPAPEIALYVDRKIKIRKEELVCRLIYEEKRLYIHEVGGKG
jgi:hypothetical protein